MREARSCVTACDGWSDSIWPTARGVFRSCTYLAICSPISTSLNGTVNSCFASGKEVSGAMSRCGVYPRYQAAEISLQDPLNSPGVHLTEPVFRVVLSGADDGLWAVSYASDG